MTAVNIDLIKYKTLKNFKCKTFKILNGINILIPLEYDNGIALISEMSDYFSDPSVINKFNIIKYELNSIDDFNKLVCNDLDAIGSKIPLIIINGLSTDFMFIECAQKLDFRIKLSSFFKKFNNAHIIFFTDDYEFVSHNHSILIENSRIVRTFKSHVAFHNFIVRSSEKWDI